MSKALLEGIRVVELGAAAVGPWAAKLLGGLGAEVIKLEDPVGEISHAIPPFLNGTAALYINANLNKRNIALDLKNKDQFQQALELVSGADIFIENMRPGVMDRLGFGYAALSKLNPRLIMVSASAYGATGPMGNFAGADPFVQAFCGWCSITGSEGGRGEMLRYLAHLDITAATTCTEAALHALVEREKSGLGQLINIEMITSALSIQATRVAEFLATGEQPLPMGSAAATTVPHQAFLCEDDEYLAVGVVQPDQWAPFCRAMKLDELIDDARFKTNPERVLHRAELIPLLRERFRSRPSAWWAMRLVKERVPNGRFLDFGALLQHSQVMQNRLLTRVPSQHWGNVLTEALPWTFERGAKSLQSAGGLKGEHNEQVLRELAQRKRPAAGAGGGV
ncbi:MAG: CoA transferase [Burkholderiaceae bacterium]|nr:CoA transferase [Burkholderiaceae bacterium]